MSYKTPAASSTTHGVMSTDTYDFVVTNGVVKEREGSAVYFVGKWGNDSADGLTYSSAKLTIQAAVTAAPANSTILVYPGSYDESVTHTASGVMVKGMGFRTNIIITQADANVINAGAQTNIIYQDVTIQVTAATTAINTIQLTSGSIALRQCACRMVCAANIAAATQPAVCRITANGSVEFRRGTIEYLNTGNGGATAIKTALRVGAAGATFNLFGVRQITITNSGTALVSAVIYDESNNATFNVNDSVITVTDPDATSVIGLAYISNTATTQNFSKNIITVVATNNTGYGIYASDTGSTTRLSHNKIVITDVAGTSYSVYVGAAATVISEFDDIQAADGKAGTGTFTKVSSLSTGTETISTALTLESSTAHAPLLGQGTSPITSMAVGATGQTIIGQTGADPIWGNMTPAPAAGVTNLGLTYAGGTLTVCSASTAALGASNPGSVSITSAVTSGKIVTIPVTSNQSFIDDAGASTIINNTFGVTTGVAWDNDMPFYLYAVIKSDDADILFAISRIPHATSAPAAGKFAKTGSALGTTQGSFFAFGDPTIADYAGQPCTCIGSFRMRKVAAADDWTVQTLGDTDGIGQFQENVTFAFPAGQMGAASQYMRNNGGTAPVFSSTNYYYTIEKSGNCVCGINFDGDGGTDGAGAVAANVVTPLIYGIIGISSYHDWLYSACSGAPGIATVIISQSDVDNYFGYTTYSGTNITNAHYSNGGRFLYGNMRFRISLS